MQEIRRTTFTFCFYIVQCNELAWFPFLKKIFHQTQGMITKEMICFYVLPEKKESLDKDKSIKILTFSSQPHSPCFHVVNVQRTAVTNRKCVKLLTNQVVTRVTRRIFAVLSLLPSCCVRSLMSTAKKRSHERDPFSLSQASWIGFFEKILLCCWFHYFSVLSRFSKPFWKLPKESRLHPAP